MKKTLLLLVFGLFSRTYVCAYDFAVANSDGVMIYYNWNGTNATVTYESSPFYNSYNGDVVIPNEVVYNGITYVITAIGNMAFMYCSALTSITIPNTAISIGAAAFSNCSSLTSVTIPNSVTAIGDEAFGGCSGLTSVTIPNSVTAIRGMAFYNCSGLTSITIPASVTSIGSRTFYNCSSLKNIVFEFSTTTLSFGTSSNLSAQAFLNCPLENLYLGRTISYYSSSSPFRDKTTLKSLTFDIVYSIDMYAFAGCSGLKEIYSKQSQPPYVNSNTAFYEVNKAACILYVPIGSFNIYYNSFWRDFLIQEKDFTTETSINNVISGTEISTYVTDNGIKINGCNPLDKVNIYSIVGQIVYSSTIGDGFISYPFQKGIPYIIHTPKKSLKVIY
jgi:hypothetical protein